MPDYPLESVPQVSFTAEYISICMFCGRMFYEQGSTHKRYTSLPLTDEWFPTSDVPVQHGLSPSPLRCALPPIEGFPSSSTTHCTFSPQSTLSLSDGTILNLHAPLPPPQRPEALKNDFALVDFPVHTSISTIFPSKKRTRGEDSKSCRKFGGQRERQG